MAANDVDVLLEPSAKSRLRDCNRRVDNIFLHMQSFNKSITFSEGLRDKLKKEFEDQKQELQNFFDRKLKDWKLENDDLHEENRKLMKRLKGLDAVKGKLEEENNGKDREIKKLKDDLEDALDNKQKALSAFKVRNSKNKADADLLKKEKAELQHELDQLRRELSSDPRDNQQAIAAALSAQRAELQAEWEKISNGMKDLWNQEAQRQYQEYQDDIDNLKKQVKALEADSDSWKTQAKTAQRERVRMSDENTRLRKETDRLNQEISDLRREKGEISESRRREFDDLNSAYSRLSQQQKLEKQKNENLQEEISELEDRITKFEKSHLLTSPVPPRKRRKIREGDSIPAFVIDGSPNKIKRSYEQAFGSDEIKIDDPKVITRLTKLNPGKPGKLHPSFPLEMKGAYFNKDDKTSKFIGFELTNKENSPVELKDFYFSNKNGKKKLNIPQKRIRSGGVIRVVFGTEKDRQSKHDLLWKEDVWDGKAKEQILLCDSQKRKAEIFELEPEEYDRMNCFVM